MNRLLSNLFYSIYPNKGRYLNFSEGDTNLIITAPHGGGIRPYNIPNRKYGVKLKDTYSLELTEKILSLYSGEHPYYVISELHRSKLDLNRDIEEAAQGNLKAEKIWYSWNQLLIDFTNDIRNKYKKGLYIDIHSKGEDDYIELGYNLSAYDYLRVFRKELDSGSTIDSLKTRNNALNDLMFGPRSIKSTLETYGYKVLFPKGGEPYFNGGRNVEVFNGQGIGAVQIEVPVNVLENNLKGIAHCLYDSIEIFRDRFC